MADAQWEADNATPVPAEVTVPVTFILRGGMEPGHLIAKARQIDRQEGQEGRAYTVEQALVTVFHNAPEWLFDRPYDRRVLDGWIADLPESAWEGWELKDHQPGPAELAADKTRSSSDA